MLKLTPSNIAPGFGVEPDYSLFEVIDRVERLYPEYRPRLTETQRADYQLRVARRGHRSRTSKDHLADLRPEGQPS